MLLITIFFTLLAVNAYPSILTCPSMLGKTPGGAIGPNTSIMGAIVNGGGTPPPLDGLVQNLPACINANEQYTVALGAAGAGRVLKISGDATFTGASAIAECTRGTTNDCVHTSGCTKTGVAGGIGFSAYQGGARQVQFTVASQTAVQLSLAYTDAGPGSDATWTAQQEVPACPNNNPNPNPPTPVTQPPPVNTPPPNQGPPRNGGPTYELDLLLSLPGTVNFLDADAVKNALSEQLTIPPFYIDQASYNKAVLFLIDLNEAQEMQAKVELVTTKSIGQGRNARSPLALAIRQQILQLDGRNVDVTVEIQATRIQVNTGIPACSSFWYANEQIGAPAGNPMTVETFIAGRRVHVKATGPTDRWFALGLGQGMNNADAWDVDGNGDEVTDLRLRRQNGQAQALVDNQQNLEQEKISDVGGIRTFEFWRDRTTRDGSDNEFLCQGAISMIFATGANAGVINRAYHGANYGAKNVLFNYLNSGVGPPPTAQPTAVPTENPTEGPTQAPTEPTQNPTTRPTRSTSTPGATGEAGTPYKTEITLRMAGGVSVLDKGFIAEAFAEEMDIDPLFMDTDIFNKFVVYSPSEEEKDEIEDRAEKADFSTAFSRAVNKDVTVTISQTSTPLPLNGCTAMRQLKGQLEGTTGGIEFDYFQAGDKFQMKVRGPQGGWFSAGIAGPGGVGSKMPNADAWIYDATTDSFADYILTSYDLSGSGIRKDEQEGGSDDLRQLKLDVVDGLVEFSFWRDLDTGDSADRPIGCNEDLEFVWAGAAPGGDGGLAHHGTRRGVVTFTPSTVTTVLEANNQFGRGSAGGDDTQKRQIHGMLMGLAWLVLIPTGMLTATFRNLLCLEGKMCYNACGDKHDGSVANWFKIHRFVNMFGVLLTFGAAALAYQFVPKTPIAESDHAKIGYGICAASLLQTLMGIMRPSKDAANRVYFEWAHRILGMGTFGVAAYQIYMVFDPNRPTTQPADGEILRDYLGEVELEQVQQGVMVWAAAVLGLMTLEIARRQLSGDSSGVVMEKNRIATVV